MSLIHLCCIFQHRDRPAGFPIPHKLCAREMDLFLESMSFFAVTFHFPEATKSLLILSGFCDLPFARPPWQDNTEWLKQQARSRRRRNWRVSFWRHGSWTTVLFGPHGPFYHTLMQNGRVKANYNAASSCKDSSPSGLGPHLYGLILSLMIYLKFPFLNTVTLEIRASICEFIGDATQSLTYIISHFLFSEVPPTPHSLSLDCLRVFACTPRTVPLLITYASFYWLLMGWYMNWGLKECPYV